MMSEEFTISFYCRQMKKPPEGSFSDSWWPVQNRLGPRTIDPNHPFTRLLAEHLLN